MRKSLRVNQNLGQPTGVGEASEAKSATFSRQSAAITHSWFTLTVQDILLFQVHPQRIGLCFGKFHEIFGLATDWYDQTLVCCAASPLPGASLPNQD